tara:strand:+ start:2152 stop:2664 length:513 start_codon:yes stop_codon:yes gene_type:complete
MEFDREEFDALLSDKQTVITMTNNDAGDGERIIVADACVRPHSMLREKYLNPIRNISHVPSHHVTECPRCGDEWHALHTKLENKVEYYTCASKCGLSICADTYDRFARKINKTEGVANNMPRESEIATVTEQATISFSSADSKPKSVSFASVEEPKPTVSFTFVSKGGDE